MKKPMLAFTLSFLLPGAGLAYLGKWKWAIMNLGVVVLSGVVLASFLSDDLFTRYVRYIAVGFSGGPGGLAKVLAEQMNLRGQHI